MSFYSGAERTHQFPPIANWKNLSFHDDGHGHKVVQKSLDEFYNVKNMSLVRKPPGRLSHIELNNPEVNTDFRPRITKTTESSIDFTKLGECSGQSSARSRGDGSVSTPYGEKTSARSASERYGNSSENSPLNRQEKQKYDDWAPDAKDAFLARLEGVGTLHAQNASQELKDRFAAKMRQPHPFSHSKISFSGWQ